MAEPTIATAATRYRSGSLKILALTNLFPSALRPRHGIFLKHRLQHLFRLPNVDVRLLVPVPWFPFSARVFGSYATLAQMPREDASSGIPARILRYPMLPKISMWFTPFSIALSALKAIREMRQAGFDPDVIDAYFLYPDGVAASLVGAYLRKPVMLTALGTDATQIARQTIPGALIRWAAKRSIAVTAVCQALADRLARCGVSPEKLHVVQHGVDHALFATPVDRSALRRALGWTNFSIITVGHLAQNKGHHLAIQAIAQIPDVDLIIIGDGPDRQQLTALAQSFGVADRVRFTGPIDQTHLAELMGASDLLVSCSEYEGISNALLEALSCGTPVAATPVWGSPEIVTDPEIGLLFSERTSAAIANGIRSAMQKPWDRTYIRRHALRFDWAATAEQHRQVMLQGLEITDAHPDHLTTGTDDLLGDDLPAPCPVSAAALGSAR